ncbi:undecaprenyl-diphosphate phosphatase [Desulfosporosinus sp. FKA]|uniref:undecaprenyl-diphosphate phosphatase n=1 Tax=Desulfosporosinus sp. FKA TaxID=1969834 RepID=UPI000B49E701|nr:undecaprenyl-diphosphate phosphatase [Desulfosporosinus sp. FKA]
MSLIIKAIILGIVEGITEFLPVSSTGHLIIVNEFINFTGSFAKMFDVIIQLGAILSVVVYFWHKLFPFGRHKSRLEKAEIWDIWKKTIIGVLPALFIGALLGKRIEDKLFTPVVVALALLIGGIILIIIENKNVGGKISSIKQLSYKTALSIGFIQCLAMIPGTSRSAATIIGAMLLGSSRLVAAEFSFFLAIPTMVAASGYSLLKIGLGMTAYQLLLLAIGFVVSFIVALFVISGFMNYISKRDFKLFGYYRIVLGILVLLYFNFLK